MRRNPPAKWVLPNVVNPPTSTAWCVPVPDDPYYRAAFLGALQSLGSAYKWSDDPDHTAAQVAQVWREIIDNLEKCMSDPVTIIMDEWEDTLSICESLRWKDGVLEGLCCGEWSPIPVNGDGPIPGDGGQPDSGSRPMPGQSKCFTRAMGANDAFLIPFGVVNGDVVTVTALRGAWSDDGVNWTCYDGTPFVLGACIGTRYHVGGDPSGTLYHGQLMLDVGGQLLSATDGAVTLSGLAGQQQITVRPNFVPGSGSGGTVQYKICVLNGATPPADTWSHTFDFTLNDGGFSAFVSGVTPLAEYFAGQGWGNPTDPTVWGMQILTPPAPPSTVFTRCVMTLDSFPSDDAGPNGYLYEADNATLIQHIASAQQVYDFNFGPYTAAQIDPVYSPHGGGSTTPTAHFIVAITLYGNGVDPY